MIKLILILGMTLFMDDHTIIDFNRESTLGNWAVVDDVVMGGRSVGNMYINKEGNAVFEGSVSLDNNGGFSSIRYRFDQLDVNQFSHIVFRIRGDGKTYQFRIKTGVYDRHSYSTEFKSTKEWQVVEIPMEELSPTWRGMKLEIPDYPGEQMSELAFFIGNSREESFKLEIDSIGLR
jgi:hypothetical protein